MNGEIVGLVVAYESASLLERCIDASLSAGIDRMVIWDNSATVESRAAIASFKCDKVEVGSDGTNYGFGAGVNRAFALAETDGLVVMINPDCEPNAWAIAEMAKLCLVPAVGVVAPRMTYPGGDSGFSGGRRPSLAKEVLAWTKIDDLLPRRLRHWLLTNLRNPLRSGGGLGESLRKGEPLEVDWVSGFCAMTSAQNFLAVGGMDEDYFLYFEDVDFAIRLQQRGLRNIVVRNVAVVHAESSSTKLVGKSKHYWTGYGTYLGKHGNKFERVLASWVLRQAR